MKYFVGQIHSRPRKRQTVLVKAKNAEQFLAYLKTTTGEFVDEYEEVELIDTTKGASNGQ